MARKIQSFGKKTSRKTAGLEMDLAQGRDGNGPTDSVVLAERAAHNN
jgi:hypothetical protein